jgi:hypothetical protein
MDAFMLFLLVSSPVENVDDPQPWQAEATGLE